jgi:hypothetical protein
MKTKPIICFLGLSMFASQLFSQLNNVENTKSARLNSAYYQVASFGERGGLGYYSNPAENLFDLYHYNQFPDSIYGYDNGYINTGNSLNERLYFTLTDHTLKARNYSQIFYTTGDIYFYNEKGLLDSAILESEADQEYDDFAIKHVYTYKENLMETEWVYVDHVNDSVNNDWIKTLEVKFLYDDNNLIKEKITNGIWNIKNAYHYTPTEEGYTQIDSSFVYGSDGEWITSGISNKNFNSDSQCVLVKNLEYNLMYSSAYYQNPDRLGSLDTINKFIMEYDIEGQLQTVEEDKFDIITNLWQSVEKSVFKYYQDGPRKSKTIFASANGYWDERYCYNYFYNPLTTKIPNVKRTQFKMFPNPVDDVLIIEGISNNCELIITSFDGKIVCKRKKCNGSIVVSDLPKGVYIVAICDHKNCILKQSFIKN